MNLDILKTRIIDIPLFLSAYNLSLWDIPVSNIDILALSVGEGEILTPYFYLPNGLIISD